MSQMRITVLGTSASAPTTERGLPAVLLEYLGEGFLFDVGEGTQRQFMRFGRSFMRVTNIFISHYHGDHVFGLPGLLSTMALYGRSRPVHVWAPERQVVYVERFLRSLVPNLPFPVEFHPAAPGELFSTGDYSVRAYSLDHTVDTLAYVFEESPRIKADKEKLRKYGLHGPVVGKLKAGECVEWNGRRICPEDVVYSVPGRKIVYVADTRPVLSDLARNANVLIHEATFMHSDHDLAVEKKHSTVAEAAHVAAELNVGRLILYHFSPRIKDLSAVVEEAEKYFTPVVAAEDGYTLEI
ncbi:MAG: ribonuclease Z [Candidatus Diapherotrites archaeon]|nr:ribonuclease Z [Candidatus Diapherotrites archaeon]